MNLPNKITLTRIFMIPVFVAIFFLDGILPYNYAIAAVVFALAAFTDFIDGYIARKHKLVTNLGKFLDPIADKVLVSTAMMLLLTMPWMFWHKNMNDALYITYAVCVCVIMARELIISAFRQIAATNGLVLAAEKLGKYKTACQDVSIVVFLVAADLTGTAFNVIFGVACVLFALATILTVWSGISYVVKNKQVLKDA
ncbi:MAG: CDP-diacylglycerol--glycerol-3-phosphate 3-phosphatidyltransferase [Clostridiales bacterium]|nr:CDP-diacylglycerol--glycerol-3-phosphate 3-phosphatidyltransferase [Clostridiales bacterium]MBE7101231.1 CDP-diacylglycerol--glycerol-3-phosphate 3-phosphatidyltransferase [Clostridiales bacterium]